MEHIPVLIKEVLEALSPRSNENFIDCTLGQGGHAKLILEKTKPDGKVLGIEWDKEEIKQIEKTDRLIVINDSYANLKNIARRNNFGQVSGILFDLGFSSWQIDDSKKGFSFQRDEPLDMRYSSTNLLTAEKIVNERPEKEIERILAEYGEEKFAKKISRKIAEQRRVAKIKSTFELAEIIKEATPAFYWRGKIHYATRTFQALRIAVNGELDNIEKALPQAVDILERGGRLAVISFHSLEDRIVKNFLKQKEKEGILKLIDKKPLTPSGGEVKNNPRARSAKLRAAIKL